MYHTRQQTSTHDIVPAHCPHCAQNINAVTGNAPSGRAPKSGDRGACIHCGSVLFFDKDNVLLGTQGDLNEMPAHIRGAFEKAAGKDLVAQIPDKAPSKTRAERLKMELMASVVLSASLKSLPVAHRGRMLSQAFFGAIDGMNDEEWARFLSSEPTPCGEPNCKCHLKEARFKEAVKNLRQ